MSVRVGIDLGTTFSAVAYVDQSTGKPLIIKNQYDKTTTPSVLCFQPDGDILFGDDAKDEQLCGNPNAVSFFKRNMGQEAFSLSINGKFYNSTDLSAILLRKLKEEAEKQIHDKIDSAVITVPAYFADKERKATIEAGKRAGLNVLSIINEPSAAAFAYGLNVVGKTQTVLIYDLGGGTFDVTIAKITDNDISVLGSDGNHTLGGKDWDDRLVWYLVSEFEERTGEDIRDDFDMISSLQVVAEKTKIQLSAKNSVNVPINYHGIKENIEVTCEIFENVSSSLIDSTKDLTNGLLSSLGLSWQDIDGVILVGGSTRMRMVHDYVVKMSGKEPLSGVNVDEAVALGAAIRANIDSSGMYLPQPSSVSESQPKYRISGAKAISDVTAHSLGVILVSENGKRYINRTIIKKNSKIPAHDTIPSKLRTHGGSNELEIYVLQGDYERPLDNTILNKYTITGIQQTRNGEAVIDITYQYTENGIVEVTAKQNDTGTVLPIQIDEVPEDMSWTDQDPSEIMKNSKASNTEVDVVLAIDVSGSMDGKPMDLAKKAMIGFVDKLCDVNASIGVMAFSDKCAWLNTPTTDTRLVKKNILSLKSDYCSIGYGNATDPFKNARDVLHKIAKKKDSTVQYIVVLTDGIWSYQNNAEREAKLCHSDDIETMAIGFGSADKAFLKRIASVDEFADLTTLADLSGSFSKIAQVINNGNKGLLRK